MQWQHLDFFVMAPQESTPVGSSLSSELNFVSTLWSTPSPRRVHVSHHPSLAFPQLIMYSSPLNHTSRHQKDYRYGEMECKLAANETTTLLEKLKYRIHGRHLSWGENLFSDDVAACLGHLKAYCSISHSNLVWVLSEIVSFHPQWQELLCISLATCKCVLANNVWLQSSTTALTLQSRITCL